MEEIIRFVMLVQSGRFTVNELCEGGLARRTHSLFEFFTYERLHGQYQLWQWPRTAGWTT